MILIENLRRYFFNDCVFITNHATERFRERGIGVADIRNAILTGEIIENYPNDFPFPSCLVCGKRSDGTVIHVCMSDSGNAGKIITAYIPSADKWSEDFKTRKETTK